ncbi:MAG: trypsin-like peptidase domain-containing protein, partial [Verrucomicrobiota bacterium]
MRAWTLAVLLPLLLSAGDEPDLAPRYRLLGAAITAAVSDSIPDLAEHTVAFVHEDEIFLLGAVAVVSVSNEGYIVTKASVLSTLPSTYQVKFFDDKEYSATLIGVDRNNDVAFLQVEERKNFKPVIWGTTKHVQQGHWLVCSVPDLD